MTLLWIHLGPATWRSGFWFGLLCSKAGGSVAFLWQEDALKPLALELQRCENNHPCQLQDELNPIRRKQARLCTQAAAPNKVMVLPPKPGKRSRYESIGISGASLCAMRALCLGCTESNLVQALTDAFSMVRALLIPVSSLDYLLFNRSVQLTLWPLHQWDH